MTENHFKTKSFQFALDVVELCRDLQTTKKEFVVLGRANGKWKTTQRLGSNA